MNEGGYPQFGFNCSYHWNMFLEARYLTRDASSVFFNTSNYGSPFISILKDSKTHKFQHLPVHVIKRINVKTRLATEFYTAVYHDIYDNNQCILNQEQKKRIKIHQSQDKAMTFDM